MKHLRQRFPRNAKVPSQFALAEHLRCSANLLTDYRQTFGATSVFDLLPFIKAKIVLLLPLVRLFSYVMNGSHHDMASLRWTRIKGLAIQEFGFGTKVILSEDAPISAEQIRIYGFASFSVEAELGVLGNARTVGRNRLRWWLALFPPPSGLTGSVQKELLAGR